MSHGVLGEAIVGSGIGGTLFAGVKPGDEVVVNNRRYLAWCYHYRHQVEGQYDEWQHSVTNGEPLYPQRKLLEKLWSAPYTYRLGNKKIIVVQNLMDRGTWPCGAVSYEKHLAASGAKMADQFRVWFVEHAQHVPASMLAPGEPPVTVTKLIDYEGYVHQALRALIRWVEEGKAPLPSSRYEYTSDCAVQLSAAGAERGGIQPAIEVRGNGKPGRVEVARGQPVALQVSAQMPNQAGKIVRAEWDFDGRGSWPHRHDEIDGSSAAFTGTVQHVFDRPGTYFASCRVIGQPDGDTHSKLYQLPNVGRIRIVVS